MTLRVHSVFLCSFSVFQIDRSADRYWVKLYQIMCIFPKMHFRVWSE
jgi:hypothetical protein